MDIFNKIGNVASETYKITAEKTSKIAKEAKIKMKMNELKSKINDIYEVIGKLVYEKHTTEGDVCVKEKVEQYCKEIDEYSKQIENYRMELLNLKDKKQCENCYIEMEIDAKFCPNCGQKQPEIEVKEAEIIEENNDNTDANENKDDTENNEDNENNEN